MRICVAAVTLAVCSLVVPAAPGYDAWAWLLWGREVWEGSLSTVDGPAWKPLPVAVTTLLAPLGDAAPPAWLVVARAGAIAAALLAFVAARRLSGSLAAGVFAAAAAVLTGGFVRHAAVGDAEPLLVALALGALLLALDGRHRAALGVAGLAALVRPETWPFVAAYALWRRDRAALVLAVVVPLAWFVPEWIGSGELLRSSDRARIPNPGQPATADVPALETLAGAARVAFVPAVLLALLARGPARVIAVAGAGWIALVAAMSQAGFSGEERYVMPGAALLAVAGAAAAGRGARHLNIAAPGISTLRYQAPVAIAAAVIGLAALPRIDAIAGLGPRLEHQHELDAGLEHAIDAAGGREAVLACGRPAVGRYRGTLLAYHLDVPKRTVRADGRPGDVTFSSRLTPRAPLSPSPREPAAGTAGWRVSKRCA